MSNFPSSGKTVALLLLSTLPVAAQEGASNGGVLIVDSTGALYDVPIGMASHLCGVDAAQLTQTAAVAAQAIAGSRLIVCDVAQEIVDQNVLVPVEFDRPTAAMAQEEAGAPETDGGIAAPVDPESPSAVPSSGDTAGGTDATPQGDAGAGGATQAGGATDVGGANAGGAAATSDPAAGDADADDPTAGDAGGGNGGAAEPSAGAATGGG